MIDKCFCPDCLSKRTKDEKIKSMIILQQINQIEIDKIIKFAQNFYKTTIAPKRIKSIRTSSFNNACHEMFFENLQKYIKNCKFPFEIPNLSKEENLKLQKTNRSMKDYPKTLENDFINYFNIKVPK